MDPREPAGPRPTAPTEANDATDRDKVEKRWSGIPAVVSSFSPDLYWLAVPEVLSRNQRKAGQGLPRIGWPEAFVSGFLGDRLPVDRMLSLGCGDGSLERHLATLGAFRACDAFDLSPESIERARASARAAGLDQIEYAVRDLNRPELPRSHYDAAWFNGSLHHIEALERVLGEVALSLRPDGFLFLNEYVGASRFDFSGRQREVLEAAFTLIPGRFRRLFLANVPWEHAPAVMLPSKEDVIAVDPSEAVRSADILPVLEQHFDIVRLNRAGGSLLQFLLAGIAGNFRSDDSESIRVLEMIFAIEDTLIEVGDLESDFVFVAARPKR